MPAESEILIGEISEWAIERLVSKFGGRRIYIPHQVDPDHTIAKTIGSIEAGRLTRIHGGSVVFIPKKHKITIRARNLRILQLLIADATVEEVAKRYGMTERNVRIIAQKMSSGKFHELKERLNKSTMAS